MKGHESMGYLVVGVCALVAISALGGIAAAFMAVNTAWFLVGFEIMTLFAAVFGVLIGRGKFAQGVSLGLLCVAGAIFAGGLFGYLGAGKVLPIGTQQISLFGLLLARLGAAAILAACAAWVVLSIKPGKSLPLLVRGVLCGVPAVGLVMGVWTLRGKIAGMGLSQVVIALGGLVLGALVIGLMAAAVHLTIKAFTVADEGTQRA